MFDFTRGSARERLDRDEVAQMDEARLLVRDDRRRRPFYFDGRFLAAADLVRDQDYFLTRQADLGRAGGAGVVGGAFSLRRIAAASTTMAMARASTSATMDSSGISCWWRLTMTPATQPARQPCVAHMVKSVALSIS